jgi:glycosyltransferase involved in cell wall biosynthesis
LSNLVVAFCTYNRAARLPALVAALRRQQCPVPFEILAVDNNSSDATQETLFKLSAEPGPRLRIAREMTQGISHARNRVLREAALAEYLVFLDDDELPRAGFLASAYAALHDHGADCVGGRVHVSFAGCKRPAWLTDDLLGHYAKVDYGNDAFWMTDAARPVWTANCGYRVALFKDPDVRFDERYSRAGHGVGGGEDTVMFRTLLRLGVRIRYEPRMEVDHFVEPWRLTRRYLMRLHFVNGRRFGQYAMPDYPRSILAVPPFLVLDTLGYWLAAARLALRRDPNAFRTTLDAVHRAGSMWGRLLRWRDLRLHPSGALDGR